MSARTHSRRKPIKGNMIEASEPEAVNIVIQVLSKKEKWSK